MSRIGFDNDKYLSMQSEKIRERISNFGGKLYMEFGGKLFDDYHASRVLPGFAPDSKIKMLTIILYVNIFWFFYIIVNISHFITIYYFETILKNNFISNT